MTNTVLKYLDTMMIILIKSHIILEVKSQPYQIRPFKTNHSSFHNF